MNIHIAPCKDCQKRYVGCHAKCLDYIDWSQRRAVIRKEQYTEKSIDDRLYKMNKDRRERAKEHYYGKRK